MGISSSSAPAAPDRAAGVSKNKTIKIQLLGEPGVGKTALVTSASDPKSTFKEGKFLSTIGVDLKMMSVPHKGTKVKLHVWDHFRGRERFVPLSPLIFRGTTLFWVVFDVTNRKSFEKISHYVSEIEKNKAGTPFVLVGTKTDRRDHSSVTDIVSFTEAVQKASELGAFKYVETSSKSRKGIDELLNDKVLDMVVAYNDNERSQSEKQRKLRL
eukprot:jgi/Bigna1/52161/estExt_Genewise1Plus.C_60054